LQSGQLNNGKNAVTAIPVAPGTALRIVFGADNVLQHEPPARLRVAFFDTKWHVTNNVVVDSSTGLAGVPIPNPARTGVISVCRLDAGTANVGYLVY
jgi:hypothetical protein